MQPYLTGLERVKAQYHKPFEIIYLTRLLFGLQLENNKESKTYLELKTFPGVCGFIDCTHIRIRKPKVRGIDYYNGQEYYSVIQQGVVREDLRFIDVNAGWPGKVQDYRVMRCLPLLQYGQTLCGHGHILDSST